ncbi:MAG: hypothetical protein IJF58_05515 [Clostridia bacterium]|nr:hypothetical protein [Clostridia bacterium]
MKKGKVLIIIGAALAVLQIASLIFDLVQSGGLKFDGTIGGAVSYLSAGLAGAVLILWGFVINKRTEE